MAPHRDLFVGLALKQRGDIYDHTTQSDADPDPRSFDCSELVKWCCHRIGVAMPDGSWIQNQWCYDHGTIIPVAQAIDIEGALLFRTRGRPGHFVSTDGHVAISLGNGSTIEAKGRAWGVNVFNARGRPWTQGALVPDLDYGVAEPAPQPGRKRKRRMLIVQIPGEDPHYAWNAQFFSHIDIETENLLVNTGQALRDGNNPFPITASALNKAERRGWFNEKTQPGFRP